MVKFADLSTIYLNFRHPLAKLLPASTGTISNLVYAVVLNVSTHSIILEDDARMFGDDDAACSRKRYLFVGIEVRIPP
jgi:hypothetical protein